MHTYTMHSEQKTNCHLTLCAKHKHCKKQVNNKKDQRCFAKKQTFQKVQGGTR